MASQLDQQSESIKISNRLCANHSLEYSFILTDPKNTDIAFMCDYCLGEQSFDTKHLLSIKQIKDSDFNTIFRNWPDFTP